MSRTHRAKQRIGTPAPHGRAQIQIHLPEDVLLMLDQMTASRSAAVADLIRRHNDQARSSRPSYLEADHWPL